MLRREGHEGENVGLCFIEEGRQPRDAGPDLIGDVAPLLTRGGGRGFCVNLSVDTSSLAIMEYCREIGALYIDTVVEPWPVSA